MFAQTLVEDYALASSYHSVITKSIQEQLSDFKAHVASVDADWKPSSFAIEIPQLEGPRADEQDDSDVEIVTHREQTASDSKDTPQSVEKEGDDSIVVRGALDEESVQWWESWRKRPRKDISSRSVASNNRGKKRKLKVESDNISVNDDKERRRTVENIEMDEKNMHEDLRILIKVCCC
jgi:SWI/SNF-related matrix-associated actin-dependent regulator of chromatin subfamily B protein 1